jgi:hypothetical protein
MTLPIDVPARTAHRLAVFFFTSLFAAMPLTALAIDEPEATAEESFTDWVNRMSAFYETYPELKTQPGSGWKPFNRAKWFYEQRMVNGEIPADGRWKAFLRKRELEGLSSKQASAQWFSLGPTNLSGRILALEFDPNNPSTLYAGAASGGIWKSTDGGVTWVALDDELPTLGVGAIAVLPTNSNIVIMGTGEATNNVDRVGGVGILRSTDAGATWQTTSVSFAVNSGHGFHCMEANPVTGSILAGSTDGLWRSTDEGATWDSVKTGGHWTDIAWKPGTTDSVYVVRSGEGVSTSGIRLSVDDGMTTLPKFSVGLPVGPDWGKTKMAVTPANSNYIYVAIADQASSGLLGVYRSTDVGATWTLQSNSPNIYNAQGWYNNSLAADPNNENRIIVGGVGLYRSGNGGVTLNLIGTNVHVDHHAVAYRPGTTDNLFVGSDGGVWESTNDGTSWVDRNAGLVTYQFYDICVSQPNALLTLGGTQDQGTDRWTGTTTWLEGLGADGMVCNCDATDATRVYGEIQFGDHYVSTNSGAGWSWINNGITGNGSWVTPTDLDPQNGLHLYTATNAGIFRTTDGGANWTNVATGNATWISISPVASGTVWVMKTGGSYMYTTDDGANWSATGFYPFGTGIGTRILAHPTDSLAAFATFGGYASLAHIARTTDMGATWEDVTGDFPDQPVNAIAVDPQNTSLWFVGTDVGVWASANGGAHWEPFETGFPNAVVADLEIQDSSRKLRAGTHGRGLWEVDLTGATGVAPTITESINLMFDPPYPNPAGDGAILRYAARNPGNVTLHVYDVQGRLVSRVADHVADGIIRQLRWDASGVPDGVYFARLSSNGQEKTQKLIVVR